MLIVSKDVKKTPTTPDSSSILLEFSKNLQVVSKVTRFLSRRVSSPNPRSKGVKRIKSIATFLMQVYIGDNILKKILK
jgi:hypothetical protein